MRAGLKRQKAKCDVFISYASKDGRGLVRDLVTLLTQFGLKVWYDEVSLSAGDSLTRTIDRGLAEARYGVVVLSRDFLRKGWTEYELRGLTSREIGRDKVILPIWHNVTREDVLRFSPPLADKLALKTTELTTNQIAVAILKVAAPSSYKYLRALAAYRKMFSRGRRVRVKLKDLERSARIHESLPPAILVRIRLVHHVLGEALTTTPDEAIDSFRRDVDFVKELQVWERTALIYAEANKGRDFTLAQRRELLSLVLSLSVGSRDAFSRLRELKADDVDYVTRVVLDCERTTRAQRG